MRHNKKVDTEKRTNTYLQVMSFVVMTLAITASLVVHPEPKTEIVEKVAAEGKQEVKEVVKTKEVIKPYILKKQLPSDYNDKKEMVLMAMRYYGVKEELMDDVDRIVEQESGYDFESKASTYWSLCSNGKFVELRDYGNGVMWQDTCEHHGLNTKEKGYSHGLFHIIKPTRREFGCKEEFDTWLEEAECAAKIINSGNISRWASY